MNNSDSVNMREQNLNHLVTWLSAKHDPIPVLSTKVFLKRDLYDGFALASVKHIEKNEDSVSPIYELARRILRSREKHPYSQSLPWSAPVSFDSQREDEIENARQNSDEEWDRESFRVAVYIVTTRIHRVQSKFALVPLCDMFNVDRFGKEHNVDCSSNENEELFQCKTVRPIEPGEFLLVAYRNLNGKIATREELRSHWGIQ